MNGPIPLEPRKLPRQARSKAMFDALLEATARVLVRDGYTATTTNSVAEVAGVSVGSLYQYFPNKESLVMAVARQHWDEMAEKLQAIAGVALTGSIPLVVREYVHAMIEAHRTDPALHQAISELVLALGFEVVDEVQERALGLVRSWLELNRARVQVTDLDHAAFLLVTTVEAAVHGALMYQPDCLEDPAFENEIVDLVVRYLLPTPAA